MVRVSNLGERLDQSRIRSSRAAARINLLETNENRYGSAVALAEDNTCPAVGDPISSTTVDRGG